MNSVIRPSVPLNGQNLIRVAFARYRRPISGGRIILWINRSIAKFDDHSWSPGGIGTEVTYDDVRDTVSALSYGRFAVVK